jgi:transposase
MEGMGKGPTTRRYTDEFKRDAVALYRRSGRPITEVARELGISDTSLGTWVKEAEKNAPVEEVESAREEARLRKRIRELEEEIEILKRFTRYWVREEGK